MPRDPKTNLFFGPGDLTLGDDGTLDTIVVLPGGDELRYSGEFAAEYRDPNTGELDFGAFVRDVVWPDVCMEY